MWLIDLNCVYWAMNCHWINTILGYTWMILKQLSCETLFARNHFSKKALKCNAFQFNLTFIFQNMNLRYFGEDLDHFYSVIKASFRFDLAIGYVIKHRHYYITILLKFISILVHLFVPFGFTLAQYQSVNQIMWFHFKAIF